MVKILGCRDEIPILIELILKYTLFSKTYLAFLCIKVDVWMLITNGTQSQAIKTTQLPPSMAQFPNMARASLPRGMFLHWKRDNS